jgi:hypothetical protein
VAGQTLAFAYEDLARTGFAGTGTTQSWLTVPSSLPNLAALVSARQHGVLVWREPAVAPTAPTAIHLPASFDPAKTVVVGDILTRYGLPSTGGLRVAGEVGSTNARRLLVDPTGTGAARTHVLLLANAAAGGQITAAALAATQAELTAWAASTFG